MKKIKITAGAFWVEIPEADLYLLCGTPPDVVKHLIRQGLIGSHDRDGVRVETGPNAILLSDVLVQQGRFASLSEFPVLQMLYRQGMLVPGHPQNTGRKPLLIGDADQVKAQLRYIYRGNYGLISEEEMRHEGVEPGLIREMMGYKLRFAFGAIHPSKDFLDTRTLQDRQPVEIRNGVTLRRLGFNRFQFRHRGKSLVVDLNLSSRESYRPSYRLTDQTVERHYFSVIHCGEGDGWDTERPCMASILSYQGRIYLIDAGPNLRFTLRALGIDPSEIEGVFHTHCHDDHFAGLPALLRTDRRIKYYATPLVRASVTKKFAALLSIDEARFEEYFEIHDLEPGRWNDLHGLEVQPLYSPHPVETNVFLFRSLCDGEYRSYGHYADTTSFEVLKGMVSDDPAASPGISREFYLGIRRDYAIPLDLKKIDIGGGLIHGNAADFADDASGRLLLAHKAEPLSAAERQIGSQTRFGKVDVFAAARHDYGIERAARLLREQWPQLPDEALAPLLNCPLEQVEPDTIILRRGSRPRELLIPVYGWVERLDGERELLQNLPNGALIDADALIDGTPSAFTYRSQGHLRLLRIPADHYRRLREHWGDGAEPGQAELCRFLAGTALFGDGLSEPRRRAVAAALRPQRLTRGEEIGPARRRRLIVVEAGELLLRHHGRPLLRLGPGQACCPALLAPEARREELVLKALRNSRYLTLELDQLAGYPILLWKVRELHARWRALIRTGG